MIWVWGGSGCGVGLLVVSGKTFRVKYGWFRIQDRIWNGCYGDLGWFNLRVGGAAVGF